MQDPWIHTFHDRYTVDEYHILVGGLAPWDFMTFHSVGNVIIVQSQLTIRHIFQRGRYTTKQYTVNEVIFHLYHLVAGLEHFSIYWE